MSYALMNTATVIIMHAFNSGYFWMGPSSNYKHHAAQKWLFLNHEGVVFYQQQSNEGRELSGVLDTITIL